MILLQVAESTKSTKVSLIICSFVRTIGTNSFYLDMKKDIQAYSS